ncbi:MAG: YdcF family protein [Pseudomonadota bacterium]
MFFILSKILGFFATPSNAMASICVVGVVLYVAGRRQSGLRWLTTGVALLLLLGFSPIGNILLLPLSERFPAWRDDGGKPAGIVVLGGAIDGPGSASRGSIELNSAAERMTAAVALARQYPDARIIFTGGSGSVLPESVGEAPFAERFLHDLGLDRQRLVIEGLSRNTAENAVFTWRLVQPKPGERWLLVTSASHMPRSIGAFRAAGFEVEAYPVDWRTGGWADAKLPFGMISEGLSRVDTAMHEWIGLLVYRLTGRSSELFPGPRSVVAR